LGGREEGGNREGRKRRKEAERKEDRETYEKGFSVSAETLSEDLTMLTPG
jgi:hypothetical protein